MKNNQLKGLEEATKARSEECVRLANAAIDALKEKGEHELYTPGTKNNKSPLNYSDKIILVCAIKLHIAKILLT